MPQHGQDSGEQGRKKRTMMIEVEAKTDESIAWTLGVLNFLMTPALTNEERIKS